MSNSIDDGGPASPTVPLNFGYSPETSGAGTGSGPGMSLRDWFAGLAMQGICARSFPDKEWEQPFCEYVAKSAYEIADEMVKARKG